MDLEQYKAYFNKNDRFSIACGMRLTDIREGYARVEMTLDENGMNYMGTMHGGLLYTMADVAAGTAVVSRGKQGVTLSANTDYIRPAHRGKVTAVARVIAFGRTICRTQVDIHGQDGTLYAKSSITMFITDKDVTLPES
jgi:uncharacterized domain 1